MHRYEIIYFLNKTMTHTHYILIKKIMVTCPITIGYLGERHHVLPYNHLLS